MWFFFGKGQLNVKRTDYEEWDDLFGIFEPKDRAVRIQSINRNKVKDFINPIKIKLYLLLTSWYEIFVNTLKKACPK